MAQAIFIQSGNSIDYTPATDVKAGDVIVQNSLVGVATQDIPAGTLGALAVEGVFDVVKAAGITRNAGQLVYWDNTNKVATSTSTGNAQLGKAVQAAAGGDATVRVKLTP